MVMIYIAHFLYWYNIQMRFTSKLSMDKDQTTTPGTTCPTFYDECVGSLTSPANHYSEDAGDGAYGLQMSLQSQYILLSCRRNIINGHEMLLMLWFTFLVYYALRRRGRVLLLSSFYGCGEFLELSLVSIQFFSAHFVLLFERSVFSGL